MATSDELGDRLARDELESAVRRGTRLTTHPGQGRRSRLSRCPRQRHERRSGGSSLLICSVAVRVPLVCGVNWTESWQLCPTESGPWHVEEARKKSTAFGPVKDTAVSESGQPPAAVTVTSCDGLAAPTVPPGKTSIDGVACAAEGGAGTAVIITDGTPLVSLVKLAPAGP
jgi:hypothetical protein